MKKILIAASIVIGCSIYVFANTTDSNDCSKECSKGTKDCICVPTPNGCVCVPKVHNTTEAKSNCPNTSDCICE